MRLLFRPSPFAWLAAVGSLVLGPAASGQSDPYRGLWVGEVKLNYVNEVPVPLDDQDVPVAPDPRVATPTTDQAQLRVILHVNGAGQVALLRDVAVVNRKPLSASAGSLPTTLVTTANEADLVLLTDPRLYGQFPPQAALRIGSAVFDFGDARATAALDELVRRAAAAAARSVETNTADFTELAGLQSATSSATVLARGAADPVVTEADAAAAFDRFLRVELPSADVDAIAAAVNPAVEAQDEQVAANLLLTSSFYHDTRASNLVGAVVAAVLAAPTPTAKRTDAHNMASAYADLLDDYGRFIAGKIFGDMILGAASAAANAAALPGASSNSLRLAVNGNASVVAARGEALRIKVARYLDTRSTRAVETVIEAVLRSVVSSLPAVPGQQKALETAAIDAGRRALADSVARYPVSAMRPSAAYNDFIAGDTFTGAPHQAAAAAAAAAVSERANNALYTPTSLENAARVAALNQLKAEYGAAARALLTELPLQGVLAAGQGDPRLTYDIKQRNGTPLGPPGLAGQIVLPKDHPTNPFRHRQNPDHTTGFDLTRSLRLDFDATPSAPRAGAGYGVDLLTGIYREEVQGLHKPLGPARDLGLKTEGRFELRRISLIDALNAR